jgi:hypothetical protein
MWDVPRTLSGVLFTDVREKSQFSTADGYRLVAGYGLDFNSRWRTRFFSIPRVPMSSGTVPLFYLMGIESLIPDCSAPIGEFICTSAYTFPTRRACCRKNAVRLPWSIHCHRVVRRVKPDTYYALPLRKTYALWSNGQTCWLHTQRSLVRFPALPDFLGGSGSGTGSTQPMWG